jgi:hypothetical protein
MKKMIYCIIDGRQTISGGVGMQQRMIVDGATKQKK